MASTFHHDEVVSLLKEMGQNSDTKFIVPYDIQLVIFHYLGKVTHLYIETNYYLDPADLCNVSRVCKMFNKSASADALWVKKLIYVFLIKIGEDGSRNVGNPNRV